MRMQFIWEEAKIRNLLKVQLIIYIAGSAIPSLYGFFLPASTPHRPFIIIVPFITVFFSAVNLIFINARYPGWRFLITNLVVQLAAVVFMAITGGFSSPLQYAPYALLLITLFQLGPDATIVMGTWAVINFIGLFLWQFHSAASPQAFPDFFVYTLPYVVFVIIGRNIGVELSLQFEARKKLERIDDLKNQFIALASHYLRTPLTTFKYFIEELQETRMAAEQKERFEKLNASVAQLETLIEKMLLISSIERGSTNITLSKANVQELAENVIAETAVAVKEKGISIVLHPADSSPSFFFDKNKIAMVLRSLIDNAITFSNQGGRIDIFLEARDNNFFIRVADRGAGIKKEAMEGLFSSFNKGGMEEALHLEKPGAGLSLYLAQLIVDAHKGAITVQSQEGVGSEFTIRIPMKQA